MPDRQTSDVVDISDLVRAGMVNEFSYCPRLFFLEWVHALFADNIETVEGRWHHRVVVERDDALVERQGADRRPPPSWPRRPSPTAAPGQSQVPSGSSALDSSPTRAASLPERLDRTLVPQPLQCEANRCIGDTWKRRPYLVEREGRLEE